MAQIRTDLALEAHEILKQTDPDSIDLRGVVTTERDISGYGVTTVRIETEGGAKALGKPVGSYVTMTLDPLRRRENGSFENGASALGQIIGEMLPLKEDDSVLVVGLGNLSVTPDAVGPLAVRNLMVTRHLKYSAEETFGAFRSVAALAPGVLAETGVESREIIRSLVNRISPNAVIVADALASRSMERICRTVQIADSGIVPGSGVGNSRSAINRETLGVPVIAVGVPTVVDAGTLAADIAQHAGFHNISEEAFSAAGNSMIVTPRDIDSEVRELGRLIGCGITLALQPGITPKDVEMFLS